MSADAKNWPFDKQWFFGGYAGLNALFNMSGNHKKRICNKFIYFFFAYLQFLDSITAIVQAQDLL